MPVFFKDFDKDVADFFKKHYVEGTKGFKFEAKGKGKDETVYLNPGFEKGVFTLNVHYDMKEKGLKSKVGVANNDTVVSKVTVERAGHKFDITETLKLKDIFNYAGDVAHEWKNNTLAVYSKSTFGAGAPCNTEVHLSAAATKELTVGCQANFSVCTRALSGWKAGARFSCCKDNLLACTYDNAGTIGVAGMGIVKQAFKGADVQLVARATKSAKGGPKFDCGAQLLCPFTGAYTRVKANLAGNYGLALTKSFGDYAVTLGGEGVMGQLACPFQPGKMSVSIVRNN
eukprot:PhM_4_TR4919/c0_g1_i1/m.26171